MPRLNSGIKLAVIIGNAIIFLSSAIFALLSGLILSRRLVALNFATAREMSQYVLAISLTVWLFAAVGCCGVLNQVKRRGICSGRRLLSLFQCLLIGLLYVSSKGYSVLSMRELSISLVVDDVKSYPRYDAFETKISKYFNEAYFEGTCASIPLDSWMIQWVERSCPVTMTQAACALSTAEKVHQCDTYCPFNVWTPDRCCPSKSLCQSNPLSPSCPYRQCRVPALTQVRDWLRPFTAGVQFVAYLSGIMIIFTCLLVCYNPRDDLGLELLKTGVMTEEDIESLRSLKSTGKQMSYKNGRPTIIIGEDEAGRSTFSFAEQPKDASSNDDAGVMDNSTEESVVIETTNLVDARENGTVMKRKKTKTNGRRGTRVSPTSSVEGHTTDTTRCADGV